MAAPEPFTASVHVAAEPQRVFEYFTRPEAMVRWMGDYALLDPTVGGEFHVDVMGVSVRGQYLEVEPPHRLLISWGHAGSERLPPGSSMLEVRLRPDGDGTTVQLIHSGLPEPQAAGHARGWKRFLARLVVAAGEGAREEVHPAGE
jgi:uncharacterized protein YndB with AHSA1/START domain